MFGKPKHDGSGMGIRRNFNRGGCQGQTYYHNDEVISELRGQGVNYVPDDDTMTITNLSESSETYLSDSKINNTDLFVGFGAYGASMIGSYVILKKTGMGPVANVLISALLTAPVISSFLFSGYKQIT